MSIFEKLLAIINGPESFNDSVEKLTDFVNGLTHLEIIELVENVGIIPESVPASSSAEKKFAKSSDIVAARALQELNLQARAISERGNAADVVAKSIERAYTFVSDAKSFRLSRTAKNQKDFKVDALSKWRGSNDYAVLIAPYFQYPNKVSQIFEQSLLENVLLFSWEHLAILLRKNIQEKEAITLEQIWNFPMKHKKSISADKLQNNFFVEFNDYFVRELGIDKQEVKNLMKEEVQNIKNRATVEKGFLEREAEGIRDYSRERAIEELLNSQKIPQRQTAIDRYIGGLDDANERYFEE